MTYKDNVNEKRVKELHEFAEKKPKFYKFKLLALTLMGYGYIFLTVGVLMAAVAALIYIVVLADAPKNVVKLAIPILGLLLLTVKSLWVSIPEPYGIILESRETEKFHEFLEELRKEMKALKIHRVLVDHNFNVSVVQRPILGFLGWNRNHLIVGLPLMLSLSTEEFKVILSHELAHISKSHGSFISFIYRTRESWFRIMESLEESDNKGSFLYRWFFKWYLPKFNEHSLILVRQEELEADKLASGISGGEKVAEALVKGEVSYELLEEIFWPSVFEKANYQPLPPQEVFYDMENFLKSDNRIKKGEFLKVILMEETTATSTHPSLRDRLACLGQVGKLSEVKVENAARELFGESINTIGNILNSIWRESALESWKERHNFIIEGSRRSIELRNKSREEKLNMDEKWEICYLTEELKGEDESIEGYEEFIREYPDFMPASFALGRILLAKGKRVGIELVEKAMKGDHEYVIEGCRLIHNYYMGVENPEEARKYYDRALKHSEILDLAEVERQQLEFKDIYSQSDLREEEIIKIAEQLRAYPEIAEAYLVRKKVKYLEQKPLYALGVVLKLPWYSSKKKYKEIVDRIADEVEFKEDTLIAYLNDENFRLKKFIKRVPGARIYSKQSSE